MSVCVAMENGARWSMPSYATLSKGLSVYNSLSESTEEFCTIRENTVHWYDAIPNRPRYICGPTVYDSAHLGHARNYIAFDTIRRILEGYFGYNVEVVMNVTDVDDKIITRARQAFLLQHYTDTNKVLTADVVSFVCRAIGAFIDSLQEHLQELRRQGKTSHDPEIILYTQRVDEQHSLLRRLDEAQYEQPAGPWISEAKDALQGIQSNNR